MPYSFIQGSVENIAQQLNEKESEGYRAVYYQNKTNVVDYVQVILYKEPAPKVFRIENSSNVNLETNVGFFKRIWYKIGGR